MILNFHTHTLVQQQDSKAVLNIIVGNDATPDIRDTEWYSAGIHPWYIKNNWEEQLGQLETLATCPEVKLIGECGLDKLKGPELEVQQDVFEAHIKLAEKTAKPLVIHCVKSFSELLQIKKKLKVTVPMVVHGFNNKPETGMQLLKAGFSFSIGTAILNENSNAAHFLQKLPQDKFFLENDNRETLIEEVYQAAASLRKTTVDELKEIIFANWMSLIKES